MRIAKSRLEKRSHSIINCVSVCKLSANRLTEDMNSLNMLIRLYNLGSSVFPFVYAVSTLSESLDLYSCFGIAVLVLPGVRVLIKGFVPQFVGFRCIFMWELLLREFFEFRTPENIASINSRQPDGSKPKEIVWLYTITESDILDSRFALLLSAQ